MMYPVVEIFHSIQGEGSFMGCPVTFIRLAGCNLNCKWCDTDYELKENMLIDDILKRVQYSKVVITGGEPTIHNLEPLLKELKQKKGSFIMIETNGTNSTSNIRDLVDWIVCSPKPQNNWKINPLCKFDELKYVVDGHFNPDLHIEDEIKNRYQNKIWLQPESSKMHERFAEAYEMAMKYPYLRVGLQFHKIIGVQ
jgi:7-carboxy-7-deazaguanine synthase